MLPDKIEFLPEGNVIFSKDGVAIKGFVPNSGAMMKSGDLIEITRHNGSDTLVINWRKITTLIGKNGPVGIPASKAAFYELLFSDFFLEAPTALPTGAATAAKQDQIISYLKDVSTKAKQDSMITLLQGVSTKAKQDSMLLLLADAATKAKQDEIILQNTDIIALLSGANRSTTPMSINTDAAVVGTEYMLRTIKATSAVRIVLKDFFSTITGVNTGYVNLYKNATIDDAGAIVYTPVSGSTKLEEGAISAGSPTSQIITGPGEFVWGTGVPVSGSNAQKINLIIDLEANDVLIFAINPTVILTIASMVQTLLEV